MILNHLGNYGHIKLVTLLYYLFTVIFIPVQKPECVIDDITIVMHDEIIDNYSIVPKSVTTGICIAQSANYNLKNTTIEIIDKPKLYKFTDALYSIYVGVLTHYNGESSYIYVYDLNFLSSDGSTMLHELTHVNLHNNGIHDHNEAEIIMFVDKWIKKYYGR